MLEAELQAYIDNGLDELERWIGCNERFMTHLMLTLQHLNDDES